MSPTPSPSPTPFPTASSSAILVNFDVPTADSIHDLIYVIWFLALFVILYIGFKIGIYIYKR